MAQDGCQLERVGTISPLDTSGDRSEKWVWEMWFGRVGVKTIGASSCSSVICSVSLSGLEGLLQANQIAAKAR